VIDLCKLIDPGNITKYDKMAQGWGALKKFPHSINSTSVIT
jgi:hypothetical protein